MPSYAALRRQVVAQLRPDGNHRAILQCVAHAALCGDAQAAGLDLLSVGGRDPALNEADLIQQVVTW